MEELPEKICSDCNNKFRYYPGNTTISPKRCPRCQSLLDFNKQKERIRKNKILLSQSTLYSKNKTTASKTNKYIIKDKNGLKRLKTPKERFYESTAWKWFSRYVLLYYSIDGEVVVCSTCGKYMRINQRNCHVGHYIKVFDGNSTNYSVAFEFTNVGPQCQKDNTFMGGRQDMMVKWLESEHSVEEVNSLYLLKNKVFRLDESYLSSIAEEYKNKFNELLTQRGYVDPWKK